MKIYKPHKYQRAFHRSSARFRTLIAGRRGGKTLGGTMGALHWIDTHPNSRGMIVAPTYPMLKDVNIPMFMDWCPVEAIKVWNKQDHKIQFVNGSEVVFRSGDNPDRLRGVGLDWLWLDEASFMNREVWEVVYPALTDKGGVAWITTTPQGYDWVYEQFYKPGMEGDKDFATWRYATEDNPYIDKLLIEKAKQDLSEAMFRQEYLASFEKFEGLIYPDFEEGKHCINIPEANKQDTFFIGVDVGWNHPTAMLLMKEDMEHNLYVVDEERKSQLTAIEISNHLSAMLVRNGLKRDDVSSYIIDPASKGTQQTSGMSMFSQLEEEGWGFVPGNNDVMAGINRVTRLFRENKLFIGRNCVMLKEELMNYHWRKWKEDADNDRAKPFKLRDDLVDVLRYVVMSRPDWFEHPSLDMYGRVIEEDDEDDGGEYFESGEAELVSYEEDIF